MRKTLIVCLAVLTALAMVTPAPVAAETPAATDEDLTCEYPLELEDATGETVTIDEEPESLVALGPSDAQTVYEVGAQEKLVGMPVGPYTDYLDADEDLDVTEDDGVTVVAEEVVDRDPDVVLAANIYETNPLVEQLREAGVTVYVFSTGDSLDGVAENVRLTGEIVGECEGAEDALTSMDERLSIIEQAVEDEDRPLAYYAMGGGSTTGSGTFQDEILTTAGVENLAAEAGLEGWTEISEEVVVEEDPEWIVYDDSQDEPPVAESVTATTAYQNEQFVEVNANFMSQPGPYVLDAIEEIVQTVHPDAYADAEADLQEANEGDEGADDDGAADDNETAADDNETAADDGADADSIPGFGVPVAVAALFAALFVRLR